MSTDETKKTPSLRLYAWLCERLVDMAPPTIAVEILATVFNGPKFSIIFRFEEMRSEVSVDVGESTVEVRIVEPTAPETFLLLTWIRYSASVVEQTRKRIRSL